MDIVKKIIKLFKRRGLIGGIKISLSYIVIEILNSSFLKKMPLTTKRKIRLFFSIGYVINLKQPKTLNEKIAYSYINNTDNLKFKVHDKFFARKYVLKKNLERILIPIYEILFSSTDIDSFEIPASCVIKSNYGGSSKHVIIIKDKNKIHEELIKNNMNKWLSPYEINKQLSENYFLKDIKPCILVESLLVDPVFSFPNDYKYYIANNKILFIEVIHGRMDKGAYVNIFDANWIQMDLTHGNPKNSMTYVPDNKIEMNQIALKLCENFDFARIDLYNINGKIYFGEITPFPGNLPFKPKKYDYIFGSQFKLKY